jgi:hypothetical protein
MSRKALARPNPDTGLMETSAFATTLAGSFAGALPLGRAAVQDVLLPWVEASTITVGENVWTTSFCF